MYSKQLQTWIKQNKEKLKEVFDADYKVILEKMIDAPDDQLTTLKRFARYLKDWSIDLTNIGKDLTKQNKKDNFI